MSRPRFGRRSPKHERALLPITRVALFLAPFSKLAECADQVQPGLKFDGILFDLGVSSPQLDDAARGFSFMHDGPLDMRMSQGEGASAADIVNGASEAELIRIFREFGEERQAPRIARAIVADRQSRPFERTLQLAEMIARVARSREAGGRHKHPATRVFQALRIHVNRRTRRTRSRARRSRSSAWRRTDGSPSSAFTRSKIAWSSNSCAATRSPTRCTRACRTYRRTPGRSSNWWANRSSRRREEIERNPRARSAHLRVAERLT